MIGLLVITTSKYDDQGKTLLYNLPVKNVLVKEAV